MPFQPAPGTIGVVVHGLLNGQTTNNTLAFFQNAADPTVGDCSTIATLVNGWWAASVAPKLPDTWVGVKVTAKNLFVNGGAKAVISMVGVEGGSAGESMPNNVAPVVTFDTGQSGKSSHGRNYIPGIVNADVTINTISSTWAADIIAAYQALLPGGAFDPSPYFWSVLSRKSAGVTLLQAVAVPVLNVYFTDTTVDSQRRRLPGRGK
jgi:hypothetical protein